METILKVERLIEARLRAGLSRIPRALIGSVLGALLALAAVTVGLTIAASPALSQTVTYDLSPTSVMLTHLPVSQAVGASCGYLAVPVLALYINSPESITLYARPQVLWLLCPLLLYWVSRTWVVAHRDEMDDDPVVFAATDRVSQVVGVLCAAITLCAI